MNTVSAPVVPNLNFQRDQIRLSVDLLFQPEQIIELRALGVSPERYNKPHVEAGYFDGAHRENLIDEAIRLSSISSGVYVVMNELDPALLARSANRVQANIPTTADNNIEHRRHILIDMDVDRPSGISASDEEHAAAVDTTKDILKKLEDEGFRGLAAADSGNGCHIYIPCDLPANDNGLVQRFLQSASLRYDTDQVHVDTTVFNSSRIVKLIGTMARKGDHTPERPHRMSAWRRTPQ